MKTTAVLALACAAIGVGLAPPKAWQLEPLKEGAPGDVAEKIREVLSADALRVFDGKAEPFIDIWFRKSVPTAEPKEEQGVKLGQIADGTLLGVARFHKPGSDFKSNNFPAGVYVMRYGIQPRDGDHLGVSESRDFVLLSPLKLDTSLEPIPTGELVKLSSKVSGITHPAVLYLVKVSDAAKPPRIFHDDEHDRWLIDCEVPATGKEKSVRLGIVVVGKAAEG